MTIFAFECRHKDGDWGGTIINSTSAGRAKSDYLLDVRDVWPDVEYTDIRVRKLGGPHTSDGFVRNARYRGLPEVKCGQRVQVGDSTGWIVGHNSSANFDVLFDSGRLKGGPYNVHPCEIKLLEARPATEPNKE